MNREPEWNSDNMNKKKGDTTFVRCGWCAHAGGGSYRYNCMLDGKCNLLKSYRNDCKFDTKCRIKGLGKDDFQNIINSKEYEIRGEKKAIISTKDEIKTLKILKKQAKKVPPLAESRIYDYYNEGDIVYVLFLGKWNRGVVVRGYRHHDGCVSYVLDKYPESSGSDAGPWGCGTAVPGILKDWEYKYFLADIRAFESWIMAQDKKYNGKPLDIELYISAFKKETKCI